MNTYAWLPKKFNHARYLLRFDDLCPGMDVGKWSRYWPMLKEYRVKPILAVVPDNLDPELEGGLPDPDFWGRTRTFQSAGASIALHGFHHDCRARGRGLIGFHAQSEFCGVPEATQAAWIEAGLGILASRGLTATIWVAPRHGFDKVTLKVLRKAGINTISDGFAAAPFRWREMIWIPQQLWAPVQKDSGTWTICVHPATATDIEVGALSQFMDQFGAQFTSVQEVLAGSPVGPRTLADRVFHQRTLVRLRLSACKRHLANNLHIGNE